MTDPQEHSSELSTIPPHAHMSSFPNSSLPPGDLIRCSDSLLSAVAVAQRPAALAAAEAVEMEEGEERHRILSFNARAPLTPVNQWRGLQRPFNGAGSLTEHIMHCFSNPPSPRQQKLL